ncbi:MAG: sulfite exporter TauE/SafE family protein [Thermomicrobiales bacterium]|nr:sulfite exporter TauE/SafE family protein [Thermomicrobiales bacterium]MCO5221253.1 cytochrome c biogenesis protein CcdA [Thermomicrobiales bacterium]
MTGNVSMLAAFVAGVLSITSPCVLPLIPLYLGHIAGVSVNGTMIDRRRVFRNALAYVAGFSMVFVALGIALGAAGSLVSTAELVAGNRFWLVRIGGVLLMLLGLQQLGLITLPIIGRERRVQHFTESTGSVTSSFVIGATFGAGWSPCVGPILGAILTMAAGQGDTVRAAWLLVAYSAGLAIPFLFFAALGTTSRMLRSMTRHLSAVNSVSGGIMIAVGAIMLLGIYQQLFARIAAVVPWTPWEPSI